MSKCHIKEGSDIKATRKQERGALVAIADAVARSIRMYRTNMTPGGSPFSVC